MQRVARERYSYRISPDLPPVLTVEPGEVFAVETFDASTGRVRRASDMAEYVRTRDPQRANPSAGPIQVRGARPGDDLVVELLDIHLEPPGWLRVLPGAGLLGDEFPELTALMVDVVDGELRIDNGLRFPARPMVGVIATAPARGDYPTAWPGETGGNMDLIEVTTGARIHLPVQVEGAWLYIGDVHAAMGDGEITVSAVEICATVQARATIRPGAASPLPWLETDTHWLTYGYHRDPVEAMRRSARAMIDLLVRELGVGRSEAYAMLGGFGDVRCGQVCLMLDATAKTIFPKPRPGG